VFPNYAARKHGESVLLELSHALLLNPLTNRLKKTVVAAEIDASNSAGAYRRLTDPGACFVSLGTRRSQAPRIAKIPDYVRLVPRVFRVVRHSSFCYIFAPGHVSLLASVCCILLRKPYALYLRGEWLSVTPRILRGLRRRIFGDAKFILCTGEALAEATRTYNQFCEPVVPMSEILTVDASGRPSAQGQGPRFLYVGQIVREKGLYELVEAFKVVRQSGFPNARLTIVGAGPETAMLQRTIASEGLEDSVQMVGLIDDARILATFYQSHDALCLPTHHEGFPRVIYEAMRLGLPVIATRVGQIPTVISNEVNGLLVEGRDVRQLARAMSTVASDSSLRKRLALNAAGTFEALTRKWGGSNHGEQVLAWITRRYPNFARIDNGIG